MTWIRVAEYTYNMPRYATISIQGQFRGEAFRWAKRDIKGVPLGDVSFTKYEYRCRVIRTGTTVMCEPLTETPKKTLYTYDNGPRTSPITLTVERRKKLRKPYVELIEPVELQTVHKDRALVINGLASHFKDAKLKVYYRINSGEERLLHTGDYKVPMEVSFRRNLHYTGGTLYDGSHVLASNMNEVIGHTLSVWAVDENGNKSDIVQRAFYVGRKPMKILHKRGPLPRMPKLDPSELAVSTDNNKVFLGTAWGNHQIGGVVDNYLPDKRPFWFRHNEAEDGLVFIYDEDTSW